jgi:hypothetical protein
METTRFAIEIIVALATVIVLLSINKKGIRIAGIILLAFLFVFILNSFGIKFGPISQFIDQIFSGRNDQILETSISSRNVSENTTNQNDSFEAILINCPNIEDALGNPKTPGASLEKYVSFQEFEGNKRNFGYMIFRSSLEQQNSIYVLFPDGTYDIFPDLWEEGMQMINEDYSPPKNFYRPIQGFEFIWQEIQDESIYEDKLNWATNCEVSTDILIWPFNNGKIIKFHEIHFYKTEGNVPCIENDDFLLSKHFLLTDEIAEGDYSGSWLDISGCLNE